MIYHGDKKIKEVYFGNKSIKEAYYGNRLVWSKEQPEPPIIVPQPIDLGLPSGLLWYQMNIGASKETDNGNRCAVSDFVQNLYPDYGSYWGFVDPAVDILAPGRKTPSLGDWDELFDYTKEAVNINNNFYCKITGPNGNSIILPFGDYVIAGYVEGGDSSILKGGLIWGISSPTNYGEYVDYLGGTDDDEKKYMLRPVLTNTSIL